MEHMGQKYLKRRRTVDYAYYSCVFKKRFNCPGTMKVHRDGEIIILSAHSEHDLPNADPVPEFRRILVERAENSRERLRNIYDEEAARNPEAAMAYPYPTAHSSMNMGRRRSNPPIPQTLEALGQLLADPQWDDKYHCTVNNRTEPFCRSTVQGAAGVGIILASQALLDMVVGGVEEIHLDGTFKCVPRVPPSYQLLTIHFVVVDKTLPIAFILMSNKTQALYEAVLEEFLIFAPTLQPQIIMCDFELGLRNALGRIFPQSDVVGCFFHYANAVWKKAASLGLIRDIAIDADRKKAIKMLLALPLLPADNFEPGLLLIETWCVDPARRINLDDLFAYIRRYWIRNVQPEHISVYGLARRTNNNVESFNKILLTKMGLHPNVFVFIEKLIQLTIRTAVQYEQLQRGLRVARPLNHRYLANDVRIRDAQTNWANGIYTTFHFLEIVAHAVENIADDLRQAPDIRRIDDEEGNPDIDNAAPAPAEADIDNAAPAPAEADIDNAAPAPAAAEEIQPEDLQVGRQPDEIRPEDLQVERQPDEARFICICCQQEQPTHACIPCGHQCVCGVCGDELIRRAERCPVCRSDIEMAIRIFR